MKIGPFEKTPTYESFLLWNFPPSKNLPLKIAPKKITPQKINPKKIVPHQSFRPLLTAPPHK